VEEGGGGERERERVGKSSLRITDGRLSVGTRKHDEE